MPTNLAAEARVRAVFFIVDVTTVRLKVIGELVDTRKLTPQMAIYCRLDLVPPLADRFICGIAPSITARYFSSCPSDSTSRWTACPPKNCKQRRNLRRLCRSRLISRGARNDLRETASHCETPRKQPAPRMPSTRFIQ